MSNKFKIGEGIEPKCSYCEYAVGTTEDCFLCSKKGIVDGEGSCGKYKYDITKREPAPRQVLTEHDESEFSL